VGEARVVHHRERCQHSIGQADHLGRLESPAVGAGSREAVRVRRPGDDVHRAARFEQQVVDGHQVRVVQQRGGTRQLAEALHEGH